MNKYIIWECKNRNELLIEILNECDLHEIQKEFLEKGYIIVRVDYAFEEVFMKVAKNDE